MTDTVAAPTAAIAAASDHETPGATNGRKIVALVTVCASLMVITLDVTILNVALPTLASELQASNSALQWFVNAYELVFAGLLLTAGALADRFGRRRVLAIGLVVFGAASAASAAATSASELIAARAVMGIGASMVVPATLSIVTNLFTSPTARAKAIAVWASVAALGLGLGPLVGGVLLRHFYWGSVFVISLPVVIGALVAGRLTIPESRGRTAGRLDPVGAGLSVVGLAALVYAVTEGPERGWAEPVVVACFGLAIIAFVTFVAWERQANNPMLDLGFFRDPRFSGAVVAVAALFFAFFGLMFVSTQVLQSVLGYDPLGAGVRLLPLPVMALVFSQVSVRVAARAGTRAVVTAGLLITACGLAAGATIDADSGYGVLAVALTLTGIGMGSTMAPAVESLMSTVPPTRAGVASAVNDTTRLTAAAIGVAVVGSLGVEPLSDVAERPRWSPHHRAARPSANFPCRRRVGRCPTRRTDSQPDRRNRPSRLRRRCVHRPGHRGDGCRSRRARRMEVPASQRAQTVVRRRRRCDLWRPATPTHRLGRIDPRSGGTPLHLGDERHFHLLAMNQTQLM